MKSSNLIIGALVLIIIGMLYIGKIRNKDVAQKDVSITALADTVHKFKTDSGNTGVYIQTLVGDNNNLREALATKASENVLYQEMLDSLKADKNIKSASVITTETKIKYEKDIDTIYKLVNFQDSIKTKWYDSYVSINKSKLNVSTNIRDELFLKSTLIDNPGLFSGKTLTTFAVSKNPSVNLIGITSVSTEVDKRKVRVGPTISVGINTDTKGSNARLGFQAGIGVQF